jgi:hypothetical protein
MSSCLDAENLLGSILRHFLTIPLSPLFFLLALLYTFLHPNRAEKYLALVRDNKSLAGLGYANKKLFFLKTPLQRIGQLSLINPSSPPSALDLS